MNRQAGYAIDSVIVSSIVILTIYQHPHIDELVLLLTKASMTETYGYAYVGTKAVLSWVALVVSAGVFVAASVRRIWHFINWCRRLIRFSRRKNKT